MRLQKFVKSFTLTAIALYLTYLFIPGFWINPKLSSLLLATLIFTLLNTFVRPIVKLFLLPINLTTLGMFRWLVNIIILYLFSYISHDVSISSFLLSDIPTLGVILPSITVGKFIATILTSIVISASQSLISWLIKWYNISYESIINRPNPGFDLLDCLNFTSIPKIRLG